MIKNVLSQVISGVISGVIVGPDLPAGAFDTIQALYYKEPVGGSEATERYQWNRDGQDDFSLRNVVWNCVNPVIEGTFIGKTTATTYFIFDGDSTGTDRAYLFVNSLTGNLNSNAATIELNGVVVADNMAAGVEGEINHYKLTFTGTYRVQVVGARYSLDQLFSPTAINDIQLTDPLDAGNSFATKFSDNGAVQGAIGVEIIGADSEFAHNNGEPDGSDFELITRKSDNSGWVGEDFIVNGEFNGAAGWTTDAGWNISGGAAFVTASAGNSNLTQGNAARDGVIYRVGLTVSSHVSGNVKVRVSSDGTEASFPSANGTFSVFVVGGASGSLRIRSENSGEMSISGVTSEPIYDYAVGSIT